MLRIIFCVFTLPLRFLYWANYFGLTTGHCLPLSTLLLPVGSSYKFKQIAMATPLVQGGSVSRSFTGCSEFIKYQFTRAGSSSLY
jgi:hypothetical protein